MSGFSGTVSEYAAKLGMAESEYEIDGILAKLAANNDLRDLSFVLERSWNKDRGWVYTVSAK